MYRVVKTSYFLKANRITIYYKELSDKQNGTKNYMPYKKYNINQNVE